MDEQKMMEEFTDDALRRLRAAVLQLPERIDQMVGLKALEHVQTELTCNREQLRAVLGKAREQVRLKEG